MSPVRQATVLPDGTRCYTGPACRRHGDAIKQANARGTEQDATRLREDIKTLLSGAGTHKDTTAPNTLHVPADYKRCPTRTPEYRPDYWYKSFEEKHQENLAILQTLGTDTTDATIADHANILQSHGTIEIPTGIPGTRLLITLQNTWRDRDRKKRWVRTWLLKDDAPVAMLRFSAYPHDMETEEGSTYPAENTIADIEVRPEMRGHHLGLELIRLTGQHVLRNKPIHSGGSYTPEGRGALGGKLPYTKTALQESRYDHKAGRSVKKILDGQAPPASFESMNFIRSWDEFQPESSGDH